MRHKHAYLLGSILSTKYILLRQFFHAAGICIVIYTVAAPLLGSVLVLSYILLHPYCHIVGVGIVVLLGSVVLLNITAGIGIMDL